MICPQLCTNCDTAESALQRKQQATFLLLNNKEIDGAEARNAAFIAPTKLALDYSNGHLHVDKDARNVYVGFLLLQKKVKDTIKFIGYGFCLRINTVH